jgi:hypothetical protein
MLNVTILGGLMFNVDMLSVVRLRVVKLGVV